VTGCSANLTSVLEQMRIRGLGVIEDAVLELSPGFTAVTGETGAGKTMVVSGLDLLFGGRAETTRIRPGADRATVEGRASERTPPRQSAKAGRWQSIDGFPATIYRTPLPGPGEREFSQPSADVNVL